MKIAAFNVENLFDRAKVFNEDNNVSTPILKAATELNTIFEKKNYSVADKKRTLELFKTLKLEKSDKGEFVLLRKIRGQIVKRPRSGALQVVATGRGDWVGWVELKTEPVHETAILNTGRVIKDVDADVLAVVEAEDRISLKKFSEIIIGKVGGIPYQQVMLVDGNDDRGIDVGILTKNNYEIGIVRSHIHDLKPDGNPIFSRDCPEYEIKTPQKNTVWVIPNHFKSKYGGNDQSSKDKRLAQSKKTAEIYNRLINNGHEYVIILGDLNDTPDSNELKPLIKNTDLKDVSEHTKFDSGKFKEIGTFGLGNNENKIDYLLVSPKLFNKITSCGLFRKGAWPGSRPKRWDTYPELTRPIHVASDHHVIWADIDV